MASALYNIFKEECLTGANNLTTVTIKAKLIDSSSYTFNAADQVIGDIIGAAILAESNALGTVTVTNGVLDTGDASSTFSSVPAGGTGDALILFIEAATARLIAYIDGFTAVTPNGGDINVTWDDGANKIFAL